MSSSPSSSSLQASRRKMLRQQRLESAVETALKMLQRAQRHLRALTYTPKGVDVSRVFALLDRDRDGSVSSSDFRHHAMRLCQLPEEWSDVVFAFFDRDQDGAVDVDDLAAFLELKLKLKPDKVKLKAGGSGLKSGREPQPVHGTQEGEALQERVLRVVREFVPAR